MFYNADHRRVSPARESTGSDLYTVLKYDPLFQTCDLAPASINQRGTLTAVPIGQSFGGAWETQINHRPTLSHTANSEQWGNASRGARWGMNYPIQPGDMARVEYQGESMSDPVITGFFRWRGDYGVPWVANQVLSQSNDYTDQTAVDDDLTDDRFDVLLPSGAWLRSTQAGSWVMATAPVDRPMAFLTLHADGQIKVKSRSGEKYTVHLEFNPEDESGRIALGTLENASYIEFKDGDITIRAKGKINLLGSQIKGDVRAQSGGGAMDALTTNASNLISDQALPGMVAQAAGEMVLRGGGGGLMPSLGKVVLKPDLNSIVGNLISNPSIDGALRGRIGDLLADGDRVLSNVQNNFNPKDLVGDFLSGQSIDRALDTIANDSAIGQRLGQLLGAQALTGRLGEITSRLDLTALPMVRELGIPSWVGRAVQETIRGGSPFGTVLNLLPEMTDSKIVDTICRFAGGLTLNGEKATRARSLLSSAIDNLPGSLKDRVNKLLEKLDSTPLKTPADGSGSTDWVQTAAQRLGRHVLRGNNLLGGSANLFDLSLLDGLNLGDANLQNIRRVAGQIEQFFTNPQKGIENLPDALSTYIPQIAEIPAEVRDAIANLPHSISEVPNLIQSALGALGENHPLHDVSGWDLSQDGLARLIQDLPNEILQKLGNLPQELFDHLSELVPDDLKTLLSNPSSILNGLDSGVINSLFGNLDDLASGTFDMKVSKQAVFSALPQIGDSLQSHGNTEFHVQTEATEIQRYLEYGSLEMPDYWGTTPYFTASENG